MEVVDPFGMAYRKCRLLKLLKRCKTGLWAYPKSGNCGTMKFVQQAAAQMVLLAKPQRMHACISGCVVKAPASQETLCACLGPIVRPLSCLSQLPTYTATRRAPAFNGAKTTPL